MECGKKRREKIWFSRKKALTLQPICTKTTFFHAFFRLGDGVMVTLQVLVLSFPVRIRVAQLSSLHPPPSTLHHSPILSTRGEAGACLSGEVAVPVDLCLWELSSQGLDELLQRLSLLGCAGVLGLHAGVESSHVADAYGVGVVPGAVCPGAPEGPASADGAVEEYEVVVANAEEASLAVPAVHVVHGAGAPLGGRSAVYDDFSYLAHGVWCVSFTGSG